MGLLSLVGLTLNASSFAGVVKGMALFPLLLVASNVGIVYFVQNPISDQLIAALPVPVEKVPALVVLSMVMLAVATGLFVIVGLNLVVGSYNNTHPRTIKGPALADSSPALFRLQSAHNNTFEALSMTTACFWVATTHTLDPVLFAKLALVILASRLLYVVAYVMDEDYLRTGLFVLAVAGFTDIGIGAIFPEYLAKYGVAPSFEPSLEAAA
jgi:uncharacterized MAPEG superfamily protein